MTPEIIAIVTVGVALAGVIIASARGVRQDVARLESRLDGRIEALESRLDGRIGALESRVEEQFNTLHGEIGELRERMAHLEGLLDGLREAITGRARAN